METNQKNFKTWKQDKKWSDIFLPEIKMYLGLHLLSEPPIEEDTERNSDLMVLKLNNIRIGCRIRKYVFFKNYKNEFTIRAGRPSGTKTEITKIIEGWGTHFFYGFSNEEENKLHAWFIGDLNVFRLWFMRQIVSNKGVWPGTKKNNHDGSSYFLCFNKYELPKNFILAER